MRYDVSIKKFKMRYFAYLNYVIPILPCSVYCTVVLYVKRLLLFRFLVKIYS